MPSIPTARKKRIKAFDCIDGGYSVFDADTKRVFSMGEKEKTVMDLLDGETSLETIAERTGMSECEINALINLFWNNGLLEGSLPLRKVNYFKLKFGLWSPNCFLNEHYKMVHILYCIINYMAVPLFIISVLLNYREIIKLTASQLIDSVTVGNVILYIFVDFMAILIHEISHGIVAKNNGANVAEIGIMLYAFMPCAYCTVCSTQSVGSIEKRCEIYMGGIKSNLLISAIVLLMVWSCRAVDLGGSTIVILFANITPIMINFLIFLKYDYYYLVAEILEEPLLREKSFNYYKNLFFAERNSICHISNVDKLLYVIYGMLSILYLMLLPVVLVISYFGVIS